MIQFHSNSVPGVFHIRLYALTLTAACLTPLPGHTDRHPSNNLRAIQSLLHGTTWTDPVPHAIHSTTASTCTCLSPGPRLSTRPRTRSRLISDPRLSTPTANHFHTLVTHAGFYHLTASGTFPPSSRGRQTGTVALAKTYVKRAGNQLGTGPLTCFSLFFCHCYACCSCERCS